MRLLLVVIIIATLFYSMTGIVYSEGGFDGALVVKPYPMHVVVFGGGEEGAWARHHPGQTAPWFMKNGLIVISKFSWEEGSPAWVVAYSLGYLVTLLAWVGIACVGVFRVVMIYFRREKI